MGFLTGRLARLADMAARADVLADIGSDHGLLPIALLQSGKVQRAIAVELSEGPFAAVTQAISREQLEARCEARMGDGLYPLTAGEADVIVIAGMGGHAIWKILTSQAAHAVLSAHSPRLVVQPMAGAGVIRFWADQAGYTIRADVRVQEGDNVYECLRLERSAAQLAAITTLPVPELRNVYDELSSAERMRLLCGEQALHSGCRLLAKQIHTEIGRRQLMMKELAYPLAERAQDRLRQVREEYGALLRLQEAYHL